MRVLRRTVTEFLRVHPLGREPIANAEVSVDVLPPRTARAQLAAQSAYEHVDRAVPVSHWAAPDRLVELLAGHDAVASFGEREHDLELARRQLERPAIGEHHQPAWPQLEVRAAQGVGVGVRTGGRGDVERHGPERTTRARARG
jgi:hypothetical protein